MVFFIPQHQKTPGMIREYKSLLSEHSKGLQYEDPNEHGKAGNHRTEYDAVPRKLIIRVHLLRHGIGRNGRR